MPGNEDLRSGSAVISQEGSSQTLDLATDALLASIDYEGSFPGDKEARAYADLLHQIEYDSHDGPALYVMGRDRRRIDTEPTDDGTVVVHVGTEDSNPYFSRDFVDVREFVVRLQARDVHAALSACSPYSFIWGEEQVEARSTNYHEYAASHDVLLRVPVRNESGKVGVITLVIDTDYGWDFALDVQRYLKGHE